MRGDDLIFLSFFRRGSKSHVFTCKAHVHVFHFFKKVFEIPVQYSSRMEAVHADNYGTVWQNTVQNSTVQYAVLYFKS